MPTATTRANAQAMPIPPRVFFDPDDCPDIYAMVCEGECLTPLYLDGSKLLFSRSEAFAPGDYVAIWIKPEYVLPGQHQVIVKRLILATGPDCARFGWSPHESLSPVILLEYLFPKRTRIGIDPQHVQAVHKCLGLMPQEAPLRIAASAGPPSQRQALEAAIENAIAMLNDLDGDGDDELSLGWTNEGKQSRLTDSQHDLEPDLGTTERIDQTHHSEGNASMPFMSGDAEPALGWTDCEDQSAIGQQDASFVLDECEEEPSGYADAAGMSDDMLGEPSLGWTEEVDQVRRLQTSAKRGQIDAEPYLGWCETDSQDADAFPTDDDMPALPIDADGDNSDADFVFRGEGYKQARKALQEANRRNPLPEDPERPRYAEKAMTMPDGSIFRTFVMENFIPAREQNRPAEAVDLRSRR